MKKKIYKSINFYVLFTFIIVFYSNFMIVSAEVVEVTDDDIAYYTSLLEEANGGNEVVIKDMQLFMAQIWLDKNYSDKIGSVSVDATSRYETCEAFVKALQVELNISELNGTFGPATKEAFDKIGPLKESQSISAIHYILNYGLWVKGYNCGYNDKGLFDSKTKDAIINIKQDIGYYDDSINGEVNSTLMKAILNTDSYKQLSNGDAKIRIMQRYINKSFKEELGIIPTDGVFQRQTMVAFTYGFQVAIGVKGANGYFGNGTTDACPTLSPEDSGTEPVRYLNYILYCNGYSIGTDEYYTSDTTNAVKKFQQFLCLSATGIADMPTIKSLFTSCGDINRAPNACDYSYKGITAAEAKALKDNGIKYVARYLTCVEGSSFQKQITSEEFKILLDAGLRVVFLFQNTGDDIGYFNSNQGYQDYLRARNALIELYPDVENSSTNKPFVYFAVDFDVYGYQVSDNIIPYFKGVNTAANEHSDVMKIGVYASRYACTTLSEKGLTQSSYVSGMSSGFSGNMGYPMPKNWAFNQYTEKQPGESSFVDFGIDYVTARNYIDFGVGESDVTENYSTNTDYEPPAYPSDNINNNATVVVNKSGEKIPVYYGVKPGDGTFEGYNKVGYIKNDDFYVMYQHDDMVRYDFDTGEFVDADIPVYDEDSYGVAMEVNFTRVLFQDEDGITRYGYIYTYLSNSTKYTFLDYTSNGETLVKNNPKSIGAEFEDCYTFILKKPLDLEDTDGINDITLPTGTQVAIGSSPKVAQTGVTHKKRILIDYIKLPGEEWETTYLYGSGFLDLGFDDYGTSPDNRAIW